MQAQVCKIRLDMVVRPAHGQPIHLRPILGSHSLTCWETHCQILLYVDCTLVWSKDSQDVSHRYTGPSNRGQIHNCTKLHHKIVIVVWSNSPTKDGGPQGQWGHWPSSMGFSGGLVRPNRLNLLEYPPIYSRNKSQLVIHQVGAFKDRSTLLSAQTDSF
jgi:hypothetical protein